MIDDLAFWSECKKRKGEGHVVGDVLEAVRCPPLNRHVADVAAAGYVARIQRRILAAGPVEDKAVLLDPAAPRQSAQRPGLLAHRYDASHRLDVLRKVALEKRVWSISTIVIGIGVFVEIVRRDCGEKNLPLYMDNDRKAAVRAIAHACYRRDLGQRGYPLYPQREREAFDAKMAEINAEAERIADEFMAYKARSAEAKRLYRCKELAEQRSAYLPRYVEARDALIAVAAPDNGGLLTKLEIAAESLDDEHAESALADARRLLSVGRA